MPSENASTKQVNNINDDHHVTSESSPMTNKQDFNGKEEEDSLTEFETKEFPAENDSARSSLTLDTVSDSSTQEINHITLTQTMPPPPVIRIEQADESSESEANNEPEKNSKTVVTSSPTLLTDFYKNPVFLMLLVAIAMIPVSVVLHMKLS